MMNTVFTSTAKSVAKGKKIKYVIFADGAKIGGRTAGRSYQAVVVCRKSYSHAVAHCRDGIKHQITEKAKYEGYIANPAASVAKEPAGFRREWLAKQIAAGDVAKWVAGCAEQIAKYEARLVELATMTQDSPEFCEWYVLAFTNTGKLPGHEYNFGERLVPLTQPEAV